MKPNNKLTYFEKQYIFYGSFHHDKWNILTHVIFVPLILWTSLGLFEKIGNIYETKIFNTQIDINLSLLTALFYIAYYLKLEFVAGLLITPILLFFNWSAVQFNRNYPVLSLKVEIGLFIVSWVAQFASHYYFEKRAPALLDGLFQALSLAPLFVFLEILFYLGYNPSYKDYTMDIISKEVFEYKQEKAAIYSK
ncbi:DUF962-domain-containing protein [Neoconidiobolus thromboides FSU 785]|nr:DUF962-domain-containing protein [Neoconidiobolus thromboides FSU 785]